MRDRKAQLPPFHLLGESVGRLTRKQRRCGKRRRCFCHFSRSSDGSSRYGYRSIHLSTRLGLTTTSPALTLVIAFDSGLADQVGEVLREQPDVMAVRPGCRRTSGFYCDSMLAEDARLNALVTGQAESACAICRENHPWPFGARQRLAVVLA
jgi:hypothetical protein